MLDPADRFVLSKLLGPGGLVEAAEDLAPYETPARYAAGKAAAVLRPANTDEVSAIVGYCVRRGLSFVPQSGNTGLVGGSTPDSSGTQLVISLERLRTPLEVRPLDRVCIVGAGVRLSTLDAALEPHGLVLPIDLGADPMIGGMAATNTGGARFLRYGDMRRHVLGLEVVLADAAGTVLDLTSDLRKDNARLDLRQIFIGSSGAFGIITKAVIEVHRRPIETAAALLVPTDDAAVSRILTALERDVGASLSAFEGMSRAVLARAFHHAPGLRNPFAGGVIPPYVLLVELSRTGRVEGEPSLDEVLQAALGGMLDQAESPLEDALFGPHEAMWAVRHALSEGLRAAGPVIGLDLSFARSKVMAVRSLLSTELEGLFPEFELCDFGHVGDGGVHFNLVRRDASVPFDAARAEALKAHVIQRAVKDFGGSFSGEHGLGPTLQSVYDQLTPSLIKRYAGRLGAAFDAAPSAVVRFSELENQNSGSD
jgi:FAD/FMN-containing dehydrogenase